MNRLILLCIQLLLCHDLLAQQAIGQWREHLPFNRGKMLADAGNKIYCATEDALFAYGKEDGELERYTRLTGLHDFGISAVSYDKSNHVLVIGFNTSNIDLLYDDGRIFNLPYIKKKNITGGKRINNIYISNGLAYLACGFGIVVIDNSKQEIRDSYLIGANGAQMNVLDVTSDGNSLFAATDSGVFSAPLTANLADFNNWSKILDDTSNAGDYSKIVYFAGKVLVNYAKPDANASASDELLSYEGGTWSQFSHPDLPLWPRRYSMRVTNDHLVVVNENSCNVFNVQFQRIAFFDGNIYSNVQMRDGWYENSSTTWIADKRVGLVRINNNAASTIAPGGPASAYVGDLQVMGEVLWVIHGPKSVSWSAQEYPVEGFSSYIDNTWSTYNLYNRPELFTNRFFSNMSSSIFPNEPNHIRVASVTTGVLDFKDGVITQFWNKDNSTLTPAFLNPGETIIHGIMHDEDGNLWVANSGVDNIFHVLKKDGNWKTFNMTGAINGSPFAGYLVIDQSNFKWINLFGGTGTTTTGLAVYDDNRTIDDVTDDRKKFIETEVYPRCLVIDKEGQLWVGTDEGPQVIYSPSTAFDDNVALQKILIFQDNSYQYLLESEVITYIAVDAANRKWIGTQSSGVYLLSADGQNEIHHFTVDNSPLFSNNITCIAISEKTGEVFIGTDKGLISYQGDAIEGGEECNNVLVYPNPVRPLYNGPIAVKGLINNARVKITDISGGIVFEGKANGGQAIWDGKNFKGEKASTGVYLVFASDEEGNNACITKLMFIK